ncbi:MAG: methyltransferase domain-containing protein [Betaproteobacteria bacterium]|nr:methyltransferase domain-containing protein [Betaproteobacteria bacterium]
MDRIRFVWELLSREIDVDVYPDSPRMELVDLVTGNPVRALELGCFKGATGAALKTRFPGLHYTGMEINARSAVTARSRIDCVLTDDLLSIDPGARPEFGQPFDLVMLADVLEHMYDPWRCLAKVGDLLAPGGRVYVSLPNCRNYQVISDLVRGNWTYRPAGILDVTHIRFFTLREALRMFHETGYVTEKIVSVRDPNVRLTGDFGAPVTIMDKAFALHDVDAPTATELSTLQFLFVLSRPAGTA